MIRIVKTALLLLVTGLGILANTSCAMAQATRTVTDMAGNRVSIPDRVTRVADLWHANNPIVLLLGGGKKLVATTPLVKHQGWIRVVDPGIAGVTAPFAGQELQIEALLKLKPDVVISADPGQIKEAKQARLPVINPAYENFAGLKRSVSLTATVLGGAAPRIARDYNQELTGNINYVKGHLKGVKTTPRVLHIVSSRDLTKVDGTKTIINEWIRLAGGKNAITRSGNMISVNSEKIIQTQPDVIIVGQSTTAQARKALQKDPALSRLKAVQNQRVYGNPQGTFPWDRYSAEEALQVLWAAQKLQPNRFRDLNMTEKTIQFYHRYYHYDLSREQARRILAGELPGK